MLRMCDWLKNRTAVARHDATEALDKLKGFTYRNNHHFIKGRQRGLR